MNRMMLLLGCVAFSVGVRADNCDSLDRLKWMLGSWEAEAGKNQIRETWTQVSAQTFEGVGQTFSKESQTLLQSESLRVLEMSGELFYLAKVTHNPLPVAFKLQNCANGQASFTNPEHDFPNRIDYQLEAPNKMSVEVSDKNGKGFSLTFFRTEAVSE